MFSETSKPTKTKQQQQSTVQPRKQYREREITIFWSESYGFQFPVGSSCDEVTSTPLPTPRPTRQPHPLCYRKIPTIFLYISCFLSVLFFASFFFFVCLSSYTRRRRKKREKKKKLLCTVVSLCFVALVSTFPQICSI